MKWIGIILLLLFVQSPASAAYRVFKLQIRYFDDLGQFSGRTRTVESTLDHLQYEHYHGGYRRMEVRLLDTWYCPGDTRHHRPLCDRPRVGERAPSSLRNEPNRVELPYNRQPIIPQ